MTATDTVKCPNCGSAVKVGTQFCTFCGTRLAPTGAPLSPGTPLVAPVPGVSVQPVAPGSGTDTSQQTQCEMIIGYLVPHRCDNPALGRCGRCGRGYCDEHVSVTPNGLLCLACEQGLVQPVALPLTAQTYDATDIAVFDAASRWDDDDDTFSDLS